MAKHPDIALKGAVEYALKSPPLAKAPLLRKLLQLLSDHRDRFLTGQEISEALWNRSEEDYDGQQVRERVSTLRRRLRELQDVTDSSYFLIVPEGEPGEGYRLTLGEKGLRKESDAFWRPHTKADDVTLVYTEPVFFYDVEAGCYIRYLDTNPNDLRSAVEELGIKHGEELRTFYAPAPDLGGAVVEMGKRQGGQLPEVYAKTLAKRLAPRTVYVAIGEVGALDILAKWFLQRSFLSVRRQASSRMPGIQEGCPILIGSERMNWLIAQLLNSEGGQQFAYRQHQRLGFVSIRDAKEKDIKEKEQSALRKRYSVSEEEGRTITGNTTARPVVRDRLAIVYRMPTPEGNGTITMISSDTAMAIRQVAFAFTDDGQAGKIMETTGWTEATLPTSFEMLFAVRVAPANIEHEAGLAELLGWRSYP